MKASPRVALVLLAGLVLAGCSSAPDDELTPPVTLKAVAGSGLFEVTLSPQAGQRLGIATEQVREEQVGVDAAAPAAHKTIPYAGVVYDGTGKTWTYTPTATLTYVRVPITVAAIVGDRAILDAGPAAGTAVVVVGAPELLGAEAQIAGEE